MDNITPAWPTEHQHDDVALLLMESSTARLVLPDGWYEIPASCWELFKMWLEGRRVRAFGRGW